MSKAAASLAFAVIFALTGGTSLRAQAAGTAFEVNDQTASESLDHWNNHYVPSLALSDDAKVGKHSIFGNFSFTEAAILYPGENLYWNLTQYEKLVFWVKSDKASDNLLVMLMANGFENRRDAAVSIGPEWKRIELPFTEEAFGQNVAGEFSFEKISAIAFYQNAGGTFKIWIDGLEFVRGTPKPPPKPKVIAAPTISLAPEKFGREIGKLEGWTLLGNCTTAEAKETEAKRCLAIEGCGYAESPKIEVIPEATYRVSGLARTEDDWQNNSCIKVKWYDKDKKPVWWEFVRRDSLTKEWKRYEKLVCAPADAAYGSIVCHAQAAWGKSSFFTDVGLAGALPSSLLWDMHFDNLDNDWVNDRSPYGNDGKAYCLSLDDLMVTQDGGAIDFNNRKAKVRFFQSKSLSPAAHDEWVLVAQFFLEEPVAPMDDVPQNASFNILGARWNTSLAVNKEGEKRTLTASFYSYLPDGSVPCYPAVSIPVEPWKWYRLTLVVNNRAHKLDARLLKSGTEILKASARITAGKLADPPFLYVGCLDYPRGGNEPYPWGFWGRMDYMRIYDSIAAYEADEKSLTFGGFGKF